MLNNILNVTDVVAVSAIEAEPGVPVWAYTAAVNLNAVRILPEGVTDIYNRQVTRADAAKMLLASHDLMEARAGNRSLLGWAS
jgi:hypothetical protein